MRRQPGQKKAISTEKAIIRLETLCARSEQCSSEVRRKLSTWLIEPAEAEKILRSLTERRFVDDSRYARSYVRDKYRFARWGRRKIEMGLRAKQIESSVIREALGEIDEKEYTDNLVHILKAKAATMTDSDTYEGRTRLFRFGASRGFEPQLVADTVRTLMKK